MAAIAKRGKAYVVRWRDPDGVQRLRRCPTKKAANDLLADVKHQLALGRRWEPPALRVELRIEEVIRAYLAEMSIHLKPRTLERYGEALDYAQACWGNIPLAELTRSHLANLWAYLNKAETARHGKPRGVSTCKKHVEAVQLWWAWAARDERFEKTCPLPRDITLPRITRKLPVAPTWAECDLMIASITVEWLRRFAILARFTGARRSEIIALDWNDVDLQEGAIRWQPETLKGGYGGRIVPMPAALKTEMAGWGKRVGRVTQAPEKELKLGHRGHVDRDLRRVWKRVGVRPEAYKGQPCHAFRKTIETELRAVGVPKEVIDRYVGHEDTSTGGQHYADPRWGWTPMSKAVEFIPPMTVAPLRLVTNADET